ncbi:unnamed protein product [Tuber aestivum]|uniref:Uncharacterized protein n=1 Tax=Tuber aestivum TaxID=59557 RepID=A0A292PMQ8_9PEZI|nr:unnamed protein product [Tuber aestivum]
MLTKFLGDGDDDDQGYFSCWAQKYASLKSFSNPKEADIPKRLVYACMFGLNELVSDLLEKGHDINAIDTEFGSPRIVVISGGHVVLVRCLIEHAPDINHPFGGLETPLQAAVLSRNREIVEMLSSNCAHVNAVGGAHGTSLQAAVYIGQEWAVELLVEGKVDRRIWGSPERRWKGGGGGEGSFRTDSGETETTAGTICENLGHPLLVTSTRGHERIVSKLIKAGASAGRVSGGYGTALWAAAAGGHTRILVVRRLLKEGADANLQAGCYSTALRATAFYSNQTIAEILLNSGADVNARRLYLGTALDAANERENQTMRALLLDRGAGSTMAGTLEPPAKLFQESELKQLFGRPWEGRYFYHDSLIPTHSDSVSINPTAASNSEIIYFNFKIAPISEVDQRIRISCRGADVVGTWVIEGVVLDDRHINFLKNYSNYECLRWEYAGQIFLEPEICIGGTWGNNGESGTFLPRPQQIRNGKGSGISSAGTT